MDRTLWKYGIYESICGLIEKTVGYKVSVRGLAALVESSPKTAAGQQLEKYEKERSRRRWDFLGKGEER